MTAPVRQPTPLEEPWFRRLSETSEQLVRHARDLDSPGFDNVWENLTVREQSFIAYGMARLIAQYRLQLGHPPDAVYGPSPEPASPRRGRYGGTSLGIG